jgi:uncharacterized LabA/DUF88 family protein
MSNPGQFPQQRVGVFVDVQNMYYSARALFDKKVNFENILKEALSGRQLVRAFAYGITTEEAHEGEFHSALSSQGFEVKTKPLQTFFGGQKKGDWDVGIAVDIIRMEPKIDVAVLVSGDGDFVPLVEFAQEKGMRLEVLAFRGSSSKLLVEAADSFVDLASEPKRFLISSRSKPRGKSTGTKPRRPRSARIVI